MSQNWSQSGKVIRGATLERPGPRVCRGEDRRCGSATGETHSCTCMRRLCVHL